MTLTKQKHKKILQKFESIPRVHETVLPSMPAPKLPPTTETTTSIADHKRNQMQFVNAEQVPLIRLLSEILEELKGLRQDLKKR